LDKDKQVIENYQNNEKMMILLYVQWCVNHDLDPVEMYEKAYPNQPKDLLMEMMEETVPKEQAEHIPDQTIINALQAFGNDDLAFAVYEEIEKQKK